MKLTILGNNSALPAFGRYPTSQVLEINEQLFLIDCGEGAQMRMQQFGVKTSRIHHIFISHLHGDHFFGLVGLISSMALGGRQKDLFIFCPPEVKAIIEIQLQWETGFTIHYRLLAEAETSILVQEDNFEVSCFPVYHSVPTHGFLFKEKKRTRTLLPEKVRAYEIPKYFYRNLTDGEDYIRQNGEVIANALLTEAGPAPLVYAYAADTRFAPEICASIEGAHLLYHEATYLDMDQHKALLRFHSTAREAAKIAKQAGVKKLLLGHFSSKYKELQPFLDEASSEFESVELALEGMVFEVGG